LKIKELPKIVVDHMEQYGGKLGFTQVTWRNLYNDPVFATFIARLYQDSFRTGIVPQSFRLTTDRSLITLVKLIDRYIGRNKFSEILSGDSFDIFNSSSFCSNLLSQLSNSWLPHVKSKQARKIPIFKRTYKGIIHRIINRRTNVWRSDKKIYDAYQLTPYKLALTKKHELTKSHLKHKYKNIDSLPLEAITRSAISTHEIYTDYYTRKTRAHLLYPYKGVRWDTYSPRK
jgi:hypothetical protein